jgi:hypothetical protein
VTRFWPGGLPINVTLDARAAPIILTLRGRQHPVIRIVERWEVDEGWWHRRTRREYVQLITASGVLLLIFHDKQQDRWFLQRLYD